MSHSDNTHLLLGILDDLATQERSLPGEWSADTARKRCEEYAVYVGELLASIHADATANPWHDDDDYPASEWRLEVAEGNTRSGYLDWVANQHDANA